jgi:hypothetical protein
MRLGSCHLGNTKWVLYPDVSWNLSVGKPPFLLAGPTLVTFLAILTEIKQFFFLLFFSENSPEPVVMLNILFTNEILVYISAGLCPCK